MLTAWEPQKRRQNDKPQHGPNDNRRGEWVRSYCGRPQELLEPGCTYQQNERGYAQPWLTLAQQVGYDNGKRNAAHKQPKTFEHKGRIRIRQIGCDVIQRHHCEDDRCQYDTGIAPACGVPIVD
ncbi:MAG: hypothetical protein HGA65_12950 [Oscillochloris sp.]|nr:hypothetical protein [Oscillochloris sp.]